MTFNPQIHHRRSMRLHEYDYSQNGAYFITICTQARASLFGTIENETIKLNMAGEKVQELWQELPMRFISIILDEWIVMPNHLHGIIVIQQEEGAASSAPTLGKIIRIFKSISAISVNRLLSRSGKPLWQRNYSEHIIRDENEFNRIRKYIMDNPLKWEMDQENMDKKTQLEATTTVL